MSKEFFQWLLGLEADKYRQPAAFVDLTSSAHGYGKTVVEQQNFLF